ncbi:MAG TPA: two-component system response regulator [Candidatus Riflebacteria bacterium]|nr:two-component system response regulator [Candidatus Riflebacteria bacterium]
MPDTANATIMVVDDNPENLKLLQAMLQGNGYRPLTFPSGYLALQAAFRHPPDLILLDIDMPVMNGFEVCRRLKAATALKEIPVLFISALDGTNDKIEAFAAGGQDYVTKPFQIEELYARVKTHLRLRKMQLELEKHNLHLRDLVEEQVREISDSQLATILALSKLSECRDEETGHHIERTQSFCEILAVCLRRNARDADVIDDAFVAQIRRAAPLHDVGKVGIPDAILLKPGTLNYAEFEIMKTHTLIGAQALKAVADKYPKNNFLNMGVCIARSHHERWDGTGYPDGLAGEAIPLVARIMTMADIYDALRSKRPYKGPFTHEQTCRIIVEGDGRIKPEHFDPLVLAAFKSVEAELDRIRTSLTDDDH